MLRSTARLSMPYHGTAQHSTAQHLGVELVGVEVHQVGGQGPGPHPLPQRLTLQIHTVHQQMLCTPQQCFLDSALHWCAALMACTLSAQT